MNVTMFYSLSYRIWVIQFLFSEVYNSFAHCLNLVLIHYWLLSFQKQFAHFVTHHLVKHLIASHQYILLHQSSRWLCRLRRVMKFCLLLWDLRIILCSHSLLFLPAKVMQNNFRKFEELVFCNLWIPDSGFRFPIPDSGFRFRIPVSGF